MSPLDRGFIATKAKFANIMRRLEAIKTKGSAPVSKVSPTLFPMVSCNYCQAMNHVFEGCPVFQAQQMLIEPMNAAFPGPIIILTLHLTILAGEIIRISHGPKTQMIKQGPTSPIIFNHPIINKIFQIKSHHLFS